MDNNRFWSYPQSGYYPDQSYQQPLQWAPQPPNQPYPQPQPQPIQQQPIYQYPQVVPENIYPQADPMTATRRATRAQDTTINASHAPVPDPYAYQQQPGIQQVTSRGRATRAPPNYSVEQLSQPAQPAPPSTTRRSGRRKANADDDDADYDEFTEYTSQQATSSHRTRRTTRNTSVNYADGYNVSEPTGDGNAGYNGDDGGYPDPSALVGIGGGASAAHNGNVKEEDPTKPIANDDDDEEETAITTRGRRIVKKKLVESSDDEAPVQKKPSRIRRKGDDDFIAEDDEEEADIVDFGDDDYDGTAPSTRRKRQMILEAKAQEAREKAQAERARQRNSARVTRNSRRNLNDPYRDDGDGNYSENDSARPTTPELYDDSDEDVLQQGKNYRLRQRKQIEYNEIAQFDKMEQQGIAKSKPKKKNWSLSGAEYEKIFGPLKGAHSDTESEKGRTPKKIGATSSMPGGVFAGGAGIPLELAGTPSNLGRVGDASLADADPLGVNTKISFDDVGGLEDHISKLKEMTLLPLLYPDMFQKMGVTPPRGVLFHGPPGTGKTLVARALAASCRSEGRSISFFMRKGADCLSKWVGEAERQLRLLFEEARKVQPSIIFFDEIDGLAPVRSSKQDQIHASIVSTLLALMDGMDGRGQVIVIGATNRPDAIDPALRRPGRFDREFYFPLPNFDARLKILKIMTKQWDNWAGPEGVEARLKLAKLTKGYGGADLKALCTEAALNAIQRQYPQIYQSSDRLLLDHSKIAVQARDFMVSVKEIVPSSQRSTGSVANALPAQLVPLLEQPLEHVKEVLDKVLPKVKKRTALDEAQWEEEADGEAAAFDREMLLQALETQRVNRPRLLLYGPPGMGQRIVGAAALHHLEGFHIQSFDLSTLTGDSGRTVEAAIVQLFVEAKRHAPSIIYIPSLAAWCSALPETARTLVVDSLESLDPTEPILLLAVHSGTFKQLPRDVRKWFGKLDINRVVLSAPDEAKRTAFFQSIVAYVQKPPSHFPDAVKRRRRILEVLPIAPPLPPRELTTAEKVEQQRQDNLLLNRLKNHLNNIYQVLVRKEKSFTKARVEQMFQCVRGEDGKLYGAPRRKPVTEPVATSAAQEPFDPNADPLNIGPNGAPADDQGEKYEIHRSELTDIDMPRISGGIWEGRFLMSQEFLRAIELVHDNATKERGTAGEQSETWFQKASRVYTLAMQEVSQTDPAFDLECQRMAQRIYKQRAAARKAAEEKEKEQSAIITQAPATSASDDITMANGTEEGSVGGSATRKRLREDEEMSEGGSDRPSKRFKGGEANSAEEVKTVRFNNVVDVVEPPAIMLNGKDPDQEMADNDRTPTSPSPIGRSTSRVVDLLASNHGPMYDPALGTPSERVSSTAVPNVPLERALLALQSTEGGIARAPEGLTQHLIVTPRTPSPAPVTPPEFQLAPELLDDLKTKLVTKTASLDVEQLEQLRAACLDTVWRYRSDWDRRSMVHALLERVDKYLEEIGEESDSDEE